MKKIKLIIIAFCCLCAYSVNADTIDLTIGMSPYEDPYDVNYPFPEFLLDDQQLTSPVIM